MKMIKITFLNKYFLLFILIFSLFMIRGTYSYLAYNYENGSVIKGNVVSVNAELKVELVTGSNKGMVPLKDSSLERAINGTGGESACVDANGNLSCQVYKITLTNKGSKIKNLKGTITLTNKDTNSTYANLKWRELASKNKIDSNKIINGMDESVLEDNLTMNSGEVKEYYIAVYIQETNVDQRVTDKGNFAGTVTFEVDDPNYCVNSKVNNLGDCILISEKKSKDVSEAKSYISSKKANFNNIAPLTKYVEKSELVEGDNIISSSNKIYFGDSYSFDEKTGRYTIVNNKLGNIKDYISTDEKKYYTCNTNTTCTVMYVIYSVTSLESNGTTTYKVTKAEKYTNSALIFDSSDVGLYKASDDYGDSYYFRGNIDNNYVEFAGYVWRIIRINGDGSIRMIYSGTSTGDMGEKTSIGTSVYNSYPYDASSVGYKYGLDLELKHSSKILNYNNLKNGNIYYFGTSYKTDDTNKNLSISGDIKSGTLDEIWRDGQNKDYKYTCFSTSKTGTCATLIEIQSYVNSNQVSAKYHSYLSKNYESTYTDEYDSDIKKKVDTWYKANIEDKGYSTYLSDTLFCNDRSLASGDGFSLDDTTIYGAYNRNVNNKAPSLKCPRQVDQFTTNKSENIGNGELTYSVGLITIDEVAMAGGKSANDNDLNWLTSGQDFWAASPSQFKSWATDASVWSVDYVGSLDHFWSTASWHGVRPVINLKKDTLISEGNGTKTNPYVIASN